MNKSSISKIISSELTPYASAILLDPEYGLPAAEVRDKMLVCCWPMKNWLRCFNSRTFTGYFIYLVCKRLKEQGADACKFLLYYDVDESDDINDQRRRLWSGLVLNVLLKICHFLRIGFL